MKPGACWLSAVSGGAGLKRILLSVAIGIFPAACSTTGHSVEKLYGPKNASKVERKGSAQMCLLVALAPADSPVWKEKSDAKIEKLKQDLRASESGQLAGRNNARFLNGGNLDFDDEGNLLAGTGDESGNAAADTFTACLLKFGWGWEKPGQSRATPPVREAKKETPYRTIETDSRVPVSSPFAAEIKDSGLLLANPTTKVIYWADEKHVVASIFEQQPWIAPDGTKKGVESIYIWNVETNELKRHAGPGAGGLCVGDGFIRYFQRRLSEGKYDELDRYFGPIGREQIRVLSGPINMQTCRLESELSSPAWLDEAKKSGRISELSPRTGFDEVTKPPGRIFEPLKPEHGWLEFVGGHKGFPNLAWYPVAIHQPGKEDKGIPIDPDMFQPWLDQGYRVAFLRYEAFRNAYLLGLDDIGGTGRNNGGFWWLFPDGRLENILIYGRNGNWKSARYFNGIQTKTTFLLIGTETHPKDKSGLYQQVVGGDLELVVKGWAEGGGYALSPDGCKLAFGIDPTGFPNSRYRLQVIDLCKASK